MEGGGSARAVARCCPWYHGRVFQVHAADVAHSSARPLRHGDGGGGELLHPLRGGRARSELAAAPGHAAAVRSLCRVRLRLFRSLQDQVAVHLAARFLQHRARRDRACRHAAGDRLRAPGAQRLRHVLLRQDHHRALLAAADRVPERAAHSLPALPLYPHPAARPGRRCRSGAGRRPRRRCRSAAARNRKRRGHQNQAGRHPLGVRIRPQPVDPRRDGARQSRGSRRRRRRSRQSRHQRHPPGADAQGRWHRKRIPKPS